MERFNKNIDEHIKYESGGGNAAYGNNTAVGTFC